MIAWLFFVHHVDNYKRLNVNYALSFKLKEKVFRFVQFKICSQFKILQLSGLSSISCHVIQNLSIPQCIRSQLQVVMFVFWIKLFSDLIGITLAYKIASYHEVFKTILTIHVVQTSPGINLEQAHAPVFWL